MCKIKSCISQYYKESSKYKYFFRHVDEAVTVRRKPSAGV